MATPVAASPGAAAAAPVVSPKIVNAERKVNNVLLELRAATTARDAAKGVLEPLDKAEAAAKLAAEQADAAEDLLAGEIVAINDQIKPLNAKIKNLNDKTSNANMTKVATLLTNYRAAATAAQEAPENNTKQQNAISKLAAYREAAAKQKTAQGELEAAKTAAAAATAEKAKLEAQKAEIQTKLDAAMDLTRKKKALLKAAAEATIEPRRLFDEAAQKVKGLGVAKQAANIALNNAKLENSTSKGIAYNNSAGSTSRKSTILGRTITTTDQIIEAAKIGNDAMLKILLEAIPIINAAKMPILNRALYAAAEFPSKNCVDLLVTKGANVTITNNGASILHAAISSLDKYKTNAKLQDKINEIIEIIKLVNTKNKYVINNKNKDGETVLHLAAKSPLKGSDKIIDVILGFRGDKNYVNIKNTSGKTALQIIHNLNATKKNIRGREGRYPINSVNFKKAAALLDKDATFPTGTNGIADENAAVYPALMKYYRKLNIKSGETSNISKIAAAADQGKLGAKTSFTVPLIGYRKGTANKYEASAQKYDLLAGRSGLNEAKKQQYINKATKYRRIATSIRNRSFKNAEKAAELKIATETAKAAAAAKNKATSPMVKRSLFNPFGFAGGGTRKNRSRKNKSTRKNRKH